MLPNVQEELKRLGSSSESGNGADGTENSKVNKSGTEDNTNNQKFGRRNRHRGPSFDVSDDDFADFDY